MTSVEVRKLHTLTGHRDSVYTVVGGDKPSLFFSGAGDGMVVLWDLSQTGEGELIAQLPNSIYALCCVGDMLIAGHNYDGIHVIDWKEKKEVSSLKLTEAAIFDIQANDGDILVASGDGALTVVRNNAVLKRLEFSQKSARTIAVGSDIAVGYSDNFIRVFDRSTYSLKKEWQAHTSSVFTLRYSPDGQVLLSGSRDARLKAWDVAGDYQLAEEVVAHMYAINSLSFSPDGKNFVTCSLDKSIKLWDAGQLKLLKVIDKARHAGHGTSVNKLLWTAFAGDPAFSESTAKEGDVHHGQVISASDDRTISIWKFIF